MKSESELWLSKPLASFFNIFLSVLSRRFRSLKSYGMPWLLYYEATTFCNLKCPSCPTGLGILDRPKKRVSIEEFKSTIDQIGGYIFELIMYNWGEPMLHKDFAELVRYASAKNIVVKTSSNLSIPLTYEQCEALVKSNLYSLKIGIDGATSSTHALYRRGAKLEVVHQNIISILSARKKLGSKYPLLHVVYHVFSHNEHETDQFCAQMKQLEVDSYSLSASWLPADGTVSKPQNPKYDIYAPTNKYLSKLREKAADLKPCSWLYHVALINPGGSVSPCCGVTSDKSDFGMLPGAISSDIASSLRSLWNGKKYQTARRLFKKTNIEKWAKTNLNDMKPDGMGLSTVAGSSMICTACPIPNTIYQSSDRISRMCNVATKELKTVARKTALVRLPAILLKVLLLKAAKAIQ